MLKSVPFPGIFTLKWEPNARRGKNGGLLFADKFSESRKAHLSRRLRVNCGAAVKISREFPLLLFISNPLPWTKSWYVPHTRRQPLLCRILLSDPPAAAVPLGSVAKARLLDAAQPSVGLPDFLVHGEPNPPLLGVSSDQVLAQLCITFVIASAVLKWPKQKLL